MAELASEVRERTDALDALGNTTAATGKGFAIGSAVLTAIALLQSFTNESGVEVVDIIQSTVLSGEVCVVKFLASIFCSSTWSSTWSSTRSSTY
jgi:Na+/H+-translocating membrane pyrophosphatase